MTKRLAKLGKPVNYIYKITPKHSLYRKFKTFKGNRNKKKIYDNNWYKRADGVKILDRRDGAFRLFPDEVERK